MGVLFIFGSKYSRALPEGLKRAFGTGRRGSLRRVPPMRAQAAYEYDALGRLRATDMTYSAAYGSRKIPEIMQTAAFAQENRHSLPVSRRGKMRAGGQR